MSESFRNTADFMPDRRCPSLLQGAAAMQAPLQPARQRGKHACATCVCGSRARHVPRTPPSTLLRALHPSYATATHLSTQRQTHPAPVNARRGVSSTDSWGALKHSQPCRQALLRSARPPCMASQVRRGSTCSFLAPRLTSCTKNCQSRGRPVTDSRIVSEHPIMFPATQGAAAAPEHGTNLPHALRTVRRSPLKPLRSDRRHGDARMYPCPTCPMHAPY